MENRKAEVQTCFATNKVSVKREWMNKRQSAEVRKYRRIGEVTHISCFEITQIGYFSGIQGWSGILEFHTLRTHN